MSAQNLGQQQFKTPTGWLIAGVILLLTGAGNLTYAVEGKEISIGDLPDLARFIISLLGITLISVGAIAVSQKWSEHKGAVLAALGVFWLMSLVAVAHDFFKPTDFAYPFTDVTYHTESGILNISLDPESLQSYGYKHYICAAVPVKGTRGVHDYANVVYSETIDTPQSKSGDLSFEISCEKSPIGTLPVGSQLKIYLIGADKPFSIRQGATAIADIDNGGKAIVRKFAASVCLRQPTAANVQKLISQLPPHEKALLNTQFNTASNP